MRDIMNGDIKSHYLCLNCQQPMKIDESSKAGKRNQDNDYSDYTTSNGHSRNLIQIICDADTPSEAPICKTCSDALLEGMEQQLDVLEGECTELRKLIDSLRTHHSQNDVTVSRQQITNLKTEERELREELARLAEDDRLGDIALQRSREERDRISGHETALWTRFRNNHKALLENDERTRCLEAEKRYAHEQLQRLTMRNVLDLAFHIWAEGPIAIINGFRLGRLPDAPVDWNEINAAWGQAALLLDVLLQRLNVQPSMYQIVAMGGHSYIKEAKPSGESRELALYAAGGWKPFGAGSHSTDDGACAFLNCLATLASALKYHNKVLPHVIRKDTLVDNGGMRFSVKMQFNSEERWTKAMKCLLSNLKTALTYVNALRESGTQSQSTASAR